MWTDSILVTKCLNNTVHLSSHTFSTFLILQHFGTWAAFLLFFDKISSFTPSLYTLETLLLKGTCKTSLELVMVSYKISFRSEVQLDLPNNNNHFLYTKINFYIWDNFLIFEIIIYIDYLYYAVNNHIQSWIHKLFSKLNES